MSRFNQLLGACVSVMVFCGGVGLLTPGESAAGTCGLGPWNSSLDDGEDRFEATDFFDDEDVVSSA